ncbi:sciellin [Sorex fumeus]|uniref:sciellin n=1 Tax=Sorex fumeus TaxID=62283 RepID=UPI0024AE841F|nr:sciellin [Sorex fumeus]
MPNFTTRKPPTTGNEMKSAIQGTTTRRQGFHDLSKRRAFLQDNSWIKKHPEEERDENYGRVVLSRHNSHDALDRKKNDGEEPKATISRYRSDDTLDRISDRNDAVKTYKANTLDNRLTNRSLSTFRSPETTKTQPGVSFSEVTTTIPASTSTTTPVKKKRQSWFPPPPPGYNAAPSPGTSRREPTVHPPIPPKPSSPISSPHMLRRDNRKICPPKPGVYTETNRDTERNIRSQDLENIVKVATSLKKTDKGEELDNLIKMNKSLTRNQGLDGLFRTSPTTEQTEKRAKSLESLIFLNAQKDKDGKGNQTLSTFMKENPRTVKNNKGNQDLEPVTKVNTSADNARRGGEYLDNVIKVNTKEHQSATGKQDLSGHIKENPETNKNIKRGQSLDNLIKVTLEEKRSSPRSKECDNLIKVNPRTDKNVQGGQNLDSLTKVTPEMKKIKQGLLPNNKENQGLDNLIKVVPSANKNSEQSLDELIKVNPKAVKITTRNQDLDKLIKVNPETLTNNLRNQDLNNLIKVNPEVIQSNQSPDNLAKVNRSALRNSKQLEGHASRSTDALNNQTTRTTVNSYEARKNRSSYEETRPAGAKDTIVYTRTYVENSKSPKVGYQENLSGKYIQTVYSTSDRSVIEKDMCTYCRKPLGTETKMILDELQICCHSTCFKCEICKKPLENLQAGDSIWIYKKTIHCEPCYSKVIAKWIQ